MPPKEQPTLSVELHKLRETAELLVDRVEDVAASIRYMTNNLLDDQYHPEMAASVRQLAQQVAQLTSHPDSSIPSESLPAFAEKLNKITDDCQSSAESEASTECESTEEKGSANRLIPLESNGRAEQTTQQPLLFGADSDPQKDDTRSAQPLLQSATASEEPSGAAEAEPLLYTLRNWQQFREQLNQGDITASELKHQFAQMAASEAEIIAALVKDHDAKQLKNWCLRWGRHPDSRKAENAKLIFRSMLQSFTLGQTISYRPFDGETHGDAVAQAVERVTEEDVTAHVAERQAAKAAHEKAINNPETFEEWRLFARQTPGGYQNFSPEQQIAYERVCADQTRAERAAQKEKTIGQLELDEDLTFTIKTGYHDKKDKPLWIVQLSNRVERTTFSQLKTKSQELGGWYSSFKKNDAGFQFYDESSAKLFTDLLDGDVDNAEAIAARKIRKMDNASERLAAVAETLESKCLEVLEADDTKLKNTVRRADMAADMRAEAQRGLATVKTLRALSQQLASGEIKYLDGVNAATQLHTITKLVRSGKYARIRLELDVMREDDQHGFKSHQRHEQMLAEPLSVEDIALAEYPFPYLYRGHLEEAFAKLGDTPGVKQVTKRMQRLIKSADPDIDSIQFRSAEQVSLLEDFLRRAQGAGYDCHWFGSCLEDYKRLRAANIYNVFELRTAMRELLPYIARPELDDAVVTAEDALRGKKLPGFFPTPRPVIYEMLQRAEIQGTDRVLEPSAGKGDILDAVCQAHPDVEVRGIEVNRSLRDVLVAKGYEESVEFGDFLEHQGPYDKIVMNPPFEHGADIDHIRHAYDLLSVGGRLVSIVCEGPFFRSDSKSKEFRDWLENLDAQIEQLPSDTFQGIEAFRQTQARVRLLTLEKHG